MAYEHKMVTLLAFGEVKEVEISHYCTDCTDENCWRWYTSYGTFAARFRTGTKVWRSLANVKRTSQYEDRAEYQLRNFDAMHINKHCTIVAWWPDKLEKIASDHSEGGQYKK